MAENKTMQTMEQQRAEYAWNKAKEQQNKHYRKDYRNLAKSAPAMIMGNGLMQTLAFLKGKGKEQHTALLGHLTGWLKKREIVDETGFDTVMNNLSSMNSTAYQRATEEAMAILRWLRHLADAACNNGGERHGG